jgi:hypothetical protein
MALTKFTDGVTTVAAAWLNQVFGDNGHVHDGQDDDGHAPKINPKHHIDWDGDDDGTAEGEMEITEDSSSAHEVTHQHLGSGVARLISDVLKAPTRVVTEFVESPGNDIQFEKSGGGLAELFTGVINASDVYLNSLNPRGGRVMPAYANGPSTPNKLAYLRSSSTPVGYGTIGWPSGNVTIRDGYNLLSVSNNGTGEYGISLDQKYSFNSSDRWQTRVAFRGEGPVVEPNNNKFYMARSTANDDGTGDVVIAFYTYEIDIGSGTVTKTSPPDNSEVMVSIFGRLT